MIKFEHTEVVGWEHAIRGMRNPLESWEKSDSNIGFGNVFCCDCGCKDMEPCQQSCVDIGSNDLDLMKRLRNAGADHRKFMRMIVVYVDITAPLYWWKEFDTYKVGTVANSCSTMHCIHKKEFTLNDFSYEHLTDFEEPLRKDANGLTRFPWFKTSLESTIDILNYARELYLETKDKKYWWQMIQLLPSSYSQKRTVMMNYEVLANMHNSRKNHKSDEWSIGFVDWIKTLPYYQLITGEETNEN